MSVPFKFSSVFAGELKFRMRTSPSSREHGYRSIRNISHVVRQRAPGTAFGSSFASAHLSVVALSLISPTMVFLPSPQVHTHGAMGVMLTRNGRR
jgi:hypothetical protein